PIPFIRSPADLLDRSASARPFCSWVVFAMYSTTISGLPTAARLPCGPVLGPDVAVRVFHERPVGRSVEPGRFVGRHPPVVTEGGQVHQLPAFVGSTAAVETNRIGTAPASAQLGLKPWRRSSSQTMACRRSASSPPSPIRSAIVRPV